MTNPRIAELGHGPKGKGCRTCKLVRTERTDAPSGALFLRHVCAATDSEYVIDVAFEACGSFAPVFAIPEREGPPPSAARDRAKAALKEKIAHKPAEPIELFT